MAAITLDIGGNTRQLDRDIQKTVNRVYNINLKTKGDQPLGRITGKVNEFNKSLDASNARVIAFGASAGIIFGVERAFTALVSSTIEVQKSLQDINVILNVSAQNLQKFGGELFNIARNTGQSFQEVAKAATEFSRQGLGVEETLKRTNEALILSRLSGLDAAKSVESLTAAVNSFASQAVTATEVVNKFATVDAAFAVSSADLADAIARVGSSAAQSGVSLNELIAIVTSAQQTTARGGAVIGNSFKTIFTRLQREKVVDLLGSLGISGTDASGQIKSTIQLLQDLGTVYDTLGSQQQAYVAEQVGGVFQINILKAALADLGKEYSIYSSALNVAAGATDQAIRRNEELNKTYSAQINALAENARQLAAAGGERLLGPSIDRLVGGTNTLLKGFSESDGQGVGAVLGKGILDGIGQFIAGPGLALIGGVLLKLFRDLGKFATGSVQQLLGLNTAATQQRDLQQSISQILAKNPQLLELALKGEQGLNTAANSLLASLQKQTVELQKQAAVAQQISKAFVAQAGVRVAGGIPVVPTPKTGRPGKAAGYIPNFAEEFQAKELGATSSVKAVRGVGKIGGKSFEANNQEFQLQNFAGTGETAVIPKYGNGIKEAAKMIARGESGSILDKNDRNKAKGFMPSFPNERLGIRGLAGKSNKFNIERYIKVPPMDYDIDGGGTPTILAGRVFESKIRGEKFVNLVENFPGADIPAGKPYGPAEAKLSLGAALRDRNILNKSGGRLVVPKSSRLSGPDFEKLTEKGINVLSHPLTHGYLFKVARSMIEQNKNKVVNPRSVPIPFSKGFIPNFAQTTTQSNKVVELGDTTTNPLFRGKVSSLIYPQISEGKSKARGETTYLGKKYRGLVSIAGINKKALKGELPDLEKNLDQLLLREANEFGQAIGGTEFLQSAAELPNIGAAKGAVGVSFEGGLLTLLKRGVQKSAQNARIDFTQDRINTKFKSLFHGAPGTYEAKYDPSLTGEVLQKMLRGAGVGEVKQVRSGAGARGFLKQREAVLASIDKDVKEGRLTQPRRGNALEAEVRKRLPLMFPGSVKGAASGFIPNFATIQDAVAREREAGIPSSQIYLAQEKALTSANPMGLGVFNKLQEPTKQSRKDAMRRKGFARGYVPNFAIEDPDTQAADFGTAATAIAAELSTLAFAFSFSGGQYKESLKQLTQANLKTAKEQLKQSRLEAKRLDQRGLGNFATTAREDASKRFRSAATPGIFTKARAFGGSNALGLSIAAPIIGETIKNIAGQETKTQRGIGAAGGALGQIGSFAATGGLIAGPKGAAVGAAVGALLSVPDAINQFTSTLPDLTAAAKKAGQDLTKFSDVSQRLLTTSDSLKNLITENAPPEKLKKVQDDFAKALSELTPAERARVDNAIKLNKLEEELAKITQEKIDKERSTVTAESLQAIEERKKFGVFAGGFDTSTKQGKEDAKVVGKAFSDLFTAGKTPEESLERFNKAASNGVPQLNKLISSAQNIATQTGATGVSADFKNQLKTILETSIPKVDDPNDQEAVAERAQKIQALVDIADDDITGFINLTKLLIATINNDKEAIKEAEKAIENHEDAVKKEEKSKKAATAATEKIIESLERNIRVAQIAADKNRELAQSNTQFARNTFFADAFSRPTETVGAIVGQGAPLAESFALREEIARIGFDQIQGIESVKFNLVKDIESSISEAFNQALKETRDKAPTEGTAKEIENTNKNILAPLAQQQEKAFNTVQNVLNKTLTAGTEINTEQLLKDINNELIKANIDAATREKISTQIRESSDAGNISIERLRNQAVQEFKTVAKEQSQRVLIAKIEQAQKFGGASVGGGIEEFINPPEPGQSAFDKLVKSTQGFEQFQGKRADFRFDYRPGTNEFKYQSAEAKRARAEMAPERGRKALAFVDQLQDFTGYTPDPEGKAVQAGVAGLTEFFNKQLRELVNIAKTTSDPLVREELNAALKEVDKLGGVENIAKLQVAQRTGSLTEDTFKEITGQFQSPVLQALQEQAKSIKNPEDRAKFLEEIKTLSSDILFSSDPTVKAINVTNNILKQMLKAAGIQYQPILSTATPSKKTESKAQGYIPAFNEEIRAISRGVGGAKAGDRPEFIPNLNGIPAFVNTGEQLVDNFMGSGETAVLTRDMQNAMVAAKGFIPNFAMLNGEEFKAFEKSILNTYNDPRSDGSGGRGWYKGADAIFEALDNNQITEEQSEYLRSKLWDQLQTRERSVYGSAGLAGVGITAGAGIAAISASEQADGSANLRNAIKYQAEWKEYLDWVKANGDLKGYNTAYKEYLADINRFATPEQLPRLTPNIDSKTLLPDSKTKPRAPRITTKGAKTSVTEAVENAGKKVASKDTLPIKPSELGRGVPKATAGRLKRAGLLSSVDEAAIIASQEAVSDRAVQRTEEALARKAAEKASGNIAGKVAGKAVGKGLAKQIPLAGTALAIGLAGYRASQGDLFGASLELGSAIPIAGVVATGALIAKDIKEAETAAKKQAEIDAKARGSARGRKQTPEEKEASKKKKQTQSLDDARYEFSTAFNKNWPLNSKDQKEFEKLWGGRPANETIPKFIKRMKESAPKQNYKTNITKATKDDINQFYQREKYAPLGSKERTDYENKSKISGLIAASQAVRYGATKKTRELDYSSGTPVYKEKREINYPTKDSFSLVEDPIQRNIDKGKVTSEYINPTIKPQRVGLINGRPAIEWENDAKIDAMDDRVKRGEISQENANKYLEAELSKKTIENRRKERSKTSPKIIGGKGNKPAMQIGSTGSADYVPKAVRATPAEIEKERQQIAKPKSTYPGGMSPETARSIVQELDATYNEAILNQRNTQKVKAWKQTQERYRLLYSQGKYEELDRFYQSLQKNYKRPVGQNPNKNQNQTNFAAGFIPNFALSSSIPNFTQDYISNLANLESGLSGEKAQLTNIPGIGLAMINEDQAPGKFPYKDHPEGKRKAVKNSMKMQKSMGVMNKGFIPNFAVTDQSFTQMESILNTNTTALTTLSGGIQTLNSTLSNFQANFANLNNNNTNNQQNNVQPNITTTTNAPVNVTVNAENNNDIATAVGEAVESAIPKIIDKVRLALGQKVPPSK